MRLLHVSDLHFGRKNLPEQVDAIRRLIARERFDVVAVSGDLTQRARAREFAKAREFLEETERVSRTIAVPGNHDCTWWRAPMHIGPRSWLYGKWRRYLGRDTEPLLRVPGATFIGVTTGHGISAHTLTKRVRDLSVLGDLRPDQIARVERHAAEGGDGEVRVVVMHHNPVAGQLSRRFGFKRAHAARILRAFTDAGVDLVLCGHDHQEAAHFVEHPVGGVLVVTAGTITTMSRGKRPTSVNVIEIDVASILVRVLIWDAGFGEFVPGPEERFAR
jgi:3',5'-cyclic AMP phosphodiesterase CpdA